MTLRRSQNISVTEMDGDLFLVRPEGGEIYHMDRMASAIWHVLEEDVPRAELHTLFHAAFPDTSADRVSRDLDQALDTLIDEGLIVETAPDRS